MANASAVLPTAIPEPFAVAAPSSYLWPHMEPASYPRPITELSAPIVSDSKERSNGVPLRSNAPHTFIVCNNGRS